MVALLGDAQPTEVTSIADRLEAVLDHGGEIPTAAITEVRSAIELLRRGRPAPAVPPLAPVRPGHPFRLYAVPRTSAPAYSDVGLLSNPD